MRYASFLLGLKVCLSSCLSISPSLRLFFAMKAPPILKRPDALEELVCAGETDWDFHSVVGDADVSDMPAEPAEDRGASDAMPAEPAEDTGASDAMPAGLAKENDASVGHKAPPPELPSDWLGEVQEDAPPPPPPPPKQTFETSGSWQRHKQVEAKETEPPVSASQPSGSASASASDAVPFKAMPAVLKGAPPKTSPPSSSSQGAPPSSSSSVAGQPQLASKEVVGEVCLPEGGGWGVLLVAYGEFGSYVYEGGCMAGMDECLSFHDHHACYCSMIGRDSRVVSYAQERAKASRRELSSRTG